MSKIVLGEDQLKAIESIKLFLESDEIAISISGFAGTGKSTITLEIINILKKYIPRKDYVLCAPTHKAKVVLERFSGEEGITLHKLLSLAPNIELLNLDFRDLKFYMGKNAPLFPIKGIVICDEASMVNDVLFDELIRMCSLYNSKIIFVGDIKQLAPVTAKMHSKVFGLTNTIHLSKIYRQSSESGLTSVLPTLRDLPISKFEESIGKEGSLICTTDIRDFFIKAMPSFKRAIKDGDILEAKMLAYTNRRVQALNNKMKQILFGTEKEYSQFEFLTAYENLEFNGTNFWNSMDYVIIDEPTKIDLNIPNFIKLPGYKLNLFNASTDRAEEINILTREISDDYLKSLAQVIEMTRLEAIELKQRGSRGASFRWRDYYNIIESFTTPVDLFYDNRVIRKKSFDYGYATTIHKS